MPASKEVKKINVPMLIVGPSGSGKSSSLRNLPPKKTAILNTERRPLPFRKFMQFKNINIFKYKELKSKLKLLAGEDGKAYDYVVIDSMTSLLEIINKYAETVFSGYNIWSEYNSMVYDVLQEIKDLPQQVIATGIPEYLELELGEQKAFLKTKGKSWKYSLEKEFSIVLHTHLIDDDEGNITAFQFDTKPSKYTSAKTPDGMLPERFIDNDILLVDVAKNEYYSDDS